VRSFIVVIPAKLFHSVSGERGFSFHDSHLCLNTGDFRREMSELGKQYIRDLNVEKLCKHLKTEDGLTLDDRGNSLLHTAVRMFATLSNTDFSGRYVLLKIMQKLITGGVQVNLLNAEGHSALFLLLCHSVYKNKLNVYFRHFPLIEAVSLLLKNWAHPDVLCSDNLIRATERFGPSRRSHQTCAHVSCVHVLMPHMPERTTYIVELLKVLFEKGDPNVVNDDNETILHHILSTPRKKEDSCFCSIDEEDQMYIGASEKPDLGTNLEGKEAAEEKTPIMKADVEMLLAVLIAFRSSLDVNKADGRNGDTILHYLAKLVSAQTVADRRMGTESSAWHAVVNCIEQLFCYKNIDIEIRNNDDYTAFDIIEVATRSVGTMDALWAKPLWGAFFAFGKYRKERDEASEEAFVPSAQVLWRRGGVHDFFGSDAILRPFDHEHCIEIANFCKRGQYVALKLLMRKRGHQQSVPWQNAFARIIGNGKLLLAVRGFKDNNPAKTPRNNALRYSYYKIVRLLIRCGVDPNAVQTSMPFTPMQVLLDRSDFFLGCGRAYAVSLSPTYKQSTSTWDHIVIADLVNAGARFGQCIVQSVFGPHKSRQYVNTERPVEHIWLKMDHIRVHEFGMLLLVLELGKGRVIGLNEQDTDGNTLIHWLVGILTGCNGWKGKSMRNLQDTKMLSRVFDLMSPLQFDARICNFNGESTGQILLKTYPGNTILSAEMKASINHFRVKAQAFILGSYSAQLHLFLLGVNDKKRGTHSHSLWLMALTSDCITLILDQILL